MAQFRDRGHDRGRGHEDGELVDKLVNTPATSLEGVLVKLRYVLDYVDETSDIGDIGGTIDFVHDAIEAIERFAAS